MLDESSIKWAVIPDRPMQQNRRCDTVQAQSVSSGWQFTPCDRTLDRYAAELLARQTDLFVQGLHEVTIATSWRQERDSEVGFFGQAVGYNQEKVDEVCAQISSISRRDQQSTQLTYGVYYQGGLRVPPAVERALRRPRSCRDCIHCDPVAISVITAPAALAISPACLTSLSDRGMRISGVTPTPCLPQNARASHTIALIRPSHGCIGDGVIMRIRNADERNAANPIASAPTAGRPGQLAGIL
jgi:hypothetical protein